MKKLTEKEVLKHYEHQSNAGYDPLLCIRRSFRIVHFGSGIVIPTITNPTGLEVAAEHHTEYFDRVITPDRYWELIKYGNVDKLDNVIFISPKSIHVVKNPAEFDCKVALFWLSPTGCETLEDLFKKHQKEIMHTLEWREKK